MMLKPLKKGPGQGKVPVLIAPGDESGADAYAALINLLEQDPTPRGRASSTPLFRRSDGQAFAPGDVTRVVRSVAARAGDRNASKFGGRALRIGGATDLHAAGVHKTTIQLLGRWSSDIYRIYTRVCANRVLKASRRMLSADGQTLEELHPAFVQ